MPYEPPPWDEPWTPGHKDRSCMCNACRDAHKIHLEKMNELMDEQEEERLRAARAPLRKRRRQKKPKPIAPIVPREPAPVTHTFEDLFAMVSCMFLERICLVGFAPVSLVRKKDEVRARVQKRKERS